MKKTQTIFAKLSPSTVLLILVCGSWPPEGQFKTATNILFSETSQLLLARQYDTNICCKEYRLENMMWYDHGKCKMEFSYIALYLHHVVCKML